MTTMAIVDFSSAHITNSRESFIAWIMLTFWNPRGSFSPRCARLPM